MLSSQQTKCVPIENCGTLDLEVERVLVRFGRGLDKISIPQNSPFTLPSSGRTSGIVFKATSILIYRDSSNICSNTLVCNKCSQPETESGFIGDLTMKMSFEEWSRKWKAARKAIGAVESVMDLWSMTNVPTGWERQTWRMGMGYRKRSKNGTDRGEQNIERMFLGAKNQINLHRLKQGRSSCPILALYHNMPMANQRRGQVIADAFAVLEFKGRFQPLAVEIKWDANDCWFALVENLQQIKMLRRNVRYLNSFINIPDSKGVWGMVLAPSKYYEINKDSLHACQPLLDRLKEKRARVLFACSDELHAHSITSVAGNWDEA